MRSIIGLLTLFSLSAIHSQATTIVHLAGDIDSFGSGLSHEDLVRVVYMQNSADDGDFDSWDLTSFTWTHTFSLPDEFVLHSATLTIVTLGIQDGGTGTSPAPSPGPSPRDLYDDRLFIDGVELPHAFDNVFTPNGTIFDALPRNISVFDLPHQFLPSLADGTLEISIDPLGGSQRDALAIDYAELSISGTTATAVPETSPTLVLMLISVSTLLLLPTLTPMFRRSSPG